MNENELKSILFIALDGLGLNKNTINELLTEPRYEKNVVNNEYLEFLQRLAEVEDPRGIDALIKFKALSLHNGKEYFSIILKNNKGEIKYVAAAISENGTNKLVYMISTS